MPRAYACTRTNGEQSRDSRRPHVSFIVIQHRYPLPTCRFVIVYYIIANQHSFSFAPIIFQRTSTSSLYMYTTDSSIQCIVFLQKCRPMMPYMWFSLFRETRRVYGSQLFLQRFNWTFLMWMNWIVERLIFFFQTNSTARKREFSFQRIDIQ